MMVRRGEWLIIAACAAGVALLAGLGVWQLQRLEWKQGLIALRQDALTARPVSMADVEAGMEHGYNVDFLKVRMQGRYRHDLERFVYRPRGQRAGYRVITPFIADSGFIVLVDRGFIDEAMLGATEKLRRPDGKIEVTGITRNRAGDAGVFTPKPEPARHVWYAYDLPGIAQSLPGDIADGFTGPPPIMSAMFVQLLPDGEPGAEKYPEPENLEVELANNHLQYAVTWFCLALVLCVMGVLFIRKRRQEMANRA